VPDLLVVNLFKLAGKVLTVRVMTIKLERLASLSSVTYALVELLKDWSVRHLEDRCPNRGYRGMRSWNMRCSPSWVMVRPQDQ